MTKYILAHDLGTSGNKASIFSEDGNLIASETTAYETFYTNNSSWVEQNANDWWEAVCTSTNRLLKKVEFDVSSIVAVSFSGQMMGCLCVDENGNTLKNSMIWADQRSQEQVKKIEKSISQDEFYKIVGHRNTASYGIQKLMWVKENEPEIYEKTYKMLNAKDFIIYKLTGKFMTDYSDANGSGCFNINTLKWSERILKAAGIDINKLPEAKASTHIVGGIIESASLLTGLAINTPVILGAGDGVTANVGAGSIHEGETYACLGTSAWITTTTKEPIYDPQMRTVNWVHAIPGYYAPNGTMQYAGGAYSWLKDTFYGEENKNHTAGQSIYELINEKIEKVPAGSNGVTFLPYLLGERAPRWDSFSRGTIIGLQSTTTKADISRAVIEGVIMNLNIIMNSLRNRINISELTVIGGGAKGSVWSEIMADAFDCKVKIPNILNEASSMGAAVIAGVGVGLFENFDVINKFIKIEKIIEINENNRAVYDEKLAIFNEYYEALAPIYKRYH